MSNLEVQGLVKRFGTNLVVDQVSFYVDEGEFFVLLGPSGGGKTTILRIISGLERPDTGRVLMSGEDVTGLAPRQRNLGMVFQDYGLYPNMDVYGNIAYGLENQRLPKAEIQQRIQQAAEMLKLTPLLRRSISALSGGEQQRVALARILARDANTFLFDEPLANLDPKLRYQARRDIISVHRLKQKPSVYVTHDQAEAFAIADRIAVIAQGRLQQVGRPAELLEVPANMFMARFIGTPPMNLLPGTLRRKEIDYAVQVKDIVFTLPQKWRTALRQYNESDIVLGIRPHVVLPEWQFSSSDNRAQVITAIVEACDVLIGEVIVKLRLSGDVTIMAVWPETDTLPDVGERVHVCIDPDTYYLFHAVTEQAIHFG
jgi:multiple sugar transport system ATP-binding protein